MTRTPNTKKSLAIAIGSAVMAYSLSGQATDFGLANDQFSVSGNVDNSTPAVADNGLIASVTGINNANLGIPTFGLSLVPQAGATDGTYAFQTYAVIADNDSQRRVEASLGTFTLTVSGGGTNVTGTFGSGQNINFFGRNGAGTVSVTGSISNVLQGVVNLSGGSITFDAATALNELEASSPATWGVLNDEFEEADRDYSYAMVFKAPSTARIGNSVGGFTEYPCASTSDIDALVVSSLAVSGPAYVLQGKFATGAAAIGGPALVPFSASCTTTTTSPDPDPDPDPEVTIEEIEDLIEDIIIVVGDVVDDATTGAVDEIADQASSIGETVSNAVRNGQLSDDNAIGALNTLSRVVEATGNVAANNSASKPTSANQTSNKGINVLSGVKDVLKALDDSANDDSDGDGVPNRELSQVQKDAVKDVVSKAVINAVKLLTSNASNTQKAVVLQNMGEILSSSINLGIDLTQEQTDSALSATDAAGTTGNIDDDLDNSVPIKPKNKNLITRNVLTTAISNAGLSEADADILLNQLRQSINPADVNVGGTNGRDALLNGLLSALSGNPGSATPNPETGRVNVRIGAGNGNSGQLAKVSPTARDIPARAISSNVVAASFPEGVRVRANGGVVITSDRISTLMVPASYSPVDFYTGLRALGNVSVGADDGNINIDAQAFPFGFHFSGTFDYTGVTSGGSPLSKTILTEPAGEDESDLSYIYTVSYPDGAMQRIQPFVSDDDFIASVRGRGLSIITNRNTGVITINGRNQYRPAYFVDQLNNTTRAFLEANADARGIAYRIIDMNEDGLMDVQIISSIGAQTAYRLP